jgi:hypothetical protein
MLRLTYTSTKVADSQATSQLAYMPSCDSFHGLNLSSELDIVRRVYRDGTLIQMGTNGSNAEQMHYSPTVDLEEMYLWSDTRVAAYAIHPISWTFDFSKPLTSAMAAGDWSNDAVFWREEDGTLKYIKKTGTKSAKQIDVTTGADEGDTIIFAGSDVIDFAPMLMGGNNLGFCSPTTGRIKVFDWATKLEVFDYFITVFSACAFDRQNRNFLSIRASDDRMQLWEENIEPAAVSTPAAAPGSSLRYLAEVMSVIVTGSNGELVPDVLVDWTVVENPGLGPAKGKVSPVQSKTNAAGVATTTYCPPGLDWVIADDELITATVTV